MTLQAAFDKYFAKISETYDITEHSGLTFYDTGDHVRPYQFNNDYIIGYTLVSPEGYWLPGIYTRNLEKVLEATEPKFYSDEGTDTIIFDMWDDASELINKHVEGILAKNNMSFFKKFTYNTTIDIGKREARREIGDYLVTAKASTISEEAFTITLTRNGEVLATRELDALDEYTNGHSLWEVYRDYIIHELEKKVPGLHVKNSGGVAPYQAEGTINGMDFYFRSRHGVATLRVSTDLYSEESTEWFTPLYGSSFEPDGGDVASPEEFAEAMIVLIKTLKPAEYMYAFEIEFPNDIWKDSTGEEDGPTLIEYNHRANTHQEAVDTVLDAYANLMRTTVQYMEEASTKFSFSPTFVEDAIAIATVHDKGSVDNRVYPEGWLENLKSSIKE